MQSAANDGVPPRVSDVALSTNVVGGFDPDRHGAESTRMQRESKPDDLAKSPAAQNQAIEANLGHSDSETCHSPLWPWRSAQSPKYRML